MSRKEHLKKSLGITEYPWSSDDEEPASAQGLPDVHLLRRQVSEPRPSVADMPGTSGQQPPTSPPLSPSNRNLNKIDKQLFYTFLNNYPPRVGSVDATRPHVHEPRPLSSASWSWLSTGPAWPAVVHTPVPELREPRERPSAATYKKLMHTLGSMRSSTSRNPMYKPPAEGNRRVLEPDRTDQALLRWRRKRTIRPWDSRRDSQLASVLKAGPGVAARAAPRPEAWLDEHVVVDEPDPVVVDEPEPVDHADDVMELHVHTTQPPEEEIVADDAEPIDVDTTNNSGGAAVSLEEEIVEIDAPDDTDTVVNVTGDGDDNNDNVVNTDVVLNEAAATSATDEAAALQQQNQEANKRRREGNSSPDDAEPFTVKEFNQSLLRLLECPVCLEWMEPPMSQCRRGHLVCARCRARLASCPVCRTTFSSVRNRAMEGVAEMVRYPCRHGCGREVRLRRRSGHESSCVARRYHCPAPACADRPPLPRDHLRQHFQGHESSCVARRYHCPAPACADRPPLPRDHLRQHFQGKHMSMLKIGRKHKFSMKVNSEQHDTWLITALQEYFYLRVDVDIRTWGVVVYVAYIGPKCNAKNFTYEVSVVGQHSSRKLVYARVTHSDLESSNLNVSRQDCFHLTLDQALNFLRLKNRHCEPDKFLDFNVEINKNEPSESRDDSDS